MKTAWSKYCLCVFVILFTSCGLIVTGSARAESWKAGVASVKITPTRYMWMAGYASRKHPADGKFADLWARTLVLEDTAGNRGALVSLDLVGMDRAMSESICRTLQQQYGLNRAQVALCFTHTHSGPVVGKSLEPLHYRQLDAPQQQLVDQYAEQLEKHVVQSVGTAIEDLKPCQLSWGSDEATFAVNRRNNAAADVPQLRANKALKGPDDHAVPVLAVHGEEGQLRAVAFGYACHATVLDDYKWCGDYPGFAAAELEARHQGCVALFWAGCGADQNPLPRRELQLAQEYGRQLADAVSRVLSGELQPVTGPLAVSYQEVPLALDKLPGEEEWKQAAQSQDPYAHARAEMLLAQIAAGGKLAQTYPYPVEVWQFGDQIQFVLLGGEVVVDYAIRLKSELDGPRTWVAGYANDVMAYIPSERVLRERGSLAKDPVALLHALRRCADRTTVFCQAGRLSAPTRHHPLFAYLEQMIVDAVRQATHSPVSH